MKMIDRSWIDHVCEVHRLTYTINVLFVIKSRGSHDLAVIVGLIGWYRELK